MLIIDNNVNQVHQIIDSCQRMVVADDRLHFLPFGTDVTVVVAAVELADALNVPAALFRFLVQTLLHPIKIID